MERTWLIQRLQKPRVTQGKLDVLAQAFCFGGGGGRLSKEAWQMLSPVFSFDYMGAAEFEFGAVPKALSHMVEQRAEYESCEFTVPRSKIAKPYRRTPYNSKKEVPLRADDPTIYVYCRKEDREEVQTRIIAVAGGNYRLKESSRLDNALDPINDFDAQTVGWLELDNGFAFFTDKAMWEQFCGLFCPETVEV